MIRFLMTSFVLLSAPALWAQGNAPPNALPPGCGVEQKEVDEAIRKGAEYLKKEADFSDKNSKAELEIYTLLHAGVPVNEAPLDEGIKWIKQIDPGKIEGFEKHKTYRIAIAAMALNSVGADANQMKMAQFAYFLVANQCRNGQWGYGDCIDVPKELKTPDDPGMVATGGGNGKIDPKSGNNGTQVKKKIPINIPKRIGPDIGDNSNTQFALLGLRACADSASGIPPQTWADALKIMAESQQSDGSWGYYSKDHEKRHEDYGYGGMTSSGIADLVICRHYLGQNWKGDPGVASGLNWMGQHFTVMENQKSGAKYDSRSFANGFHYFSLWAIERAGALAATETMGAHKWYVEGARYLIDHQNPDGSWKEEHEKLANKIEDTCFAILFLGRATPPVKISK